jgi:hypothetical protein
LGHYSPYLHDDQHLQNQLGRLKERGLAAHQTGIDVSILAYFAIALLVFTLLFSAFTFFRTGHPPTAVWSAFLK